MRIKADQLEPALAKKLEPIYLLSGDEPLQMGEAADAIREISKQQGYLSREVLSQDAGFEWHELALAADSLSIFAEKKVIDLRLNSAKFGTEGGKALTEYCQRLPEDTLLLISCPKLAAASLKSKWFLALDKVAVSVQVWPLEGGDLIQWLRRRSQKRGLQIEAQSIKLIASRIEGNLLAAAQEIEKLYILHGNTVIPHAEVEQVVADSARFDVFKLTDCVLANRVSRAIKIINGLKAEGLAAPVIVWALARETRLLISIKEAISGGQNKEAVFKQNRIWDKRKQLFNSALTRLDQATLQQALILSAKADRQIKGQEQGDCWETLFSICLTLHTQKQ